MAVRKKLGVRQPSPTTTTMPTDAEDDRFGRGGGGAGAPPPSTTRTPIGVPEGYMAEVPSWLNPSPSTARADYYARNPKMQAARYFEGDQFKPQSMAPQEIWEMQQLLSQQGLLRGRFLKGVWDENTVSAYESVLAYANQQGLTDYQALLQMGQSELLEATDEGISGMGGAGGAAPPPIRQTDPETLRAAVRRVSMEMTGVGATEEEINQFTAAYQSMERERQMQYYQSAGFGEMVGSGGEYSTAPPPEVFAEQFVEQNKGEAVQGYEARNYAAEAANILAGPSWGLG